MPRPPKYSVLRTLDPRAERRLMLEAIVRSSLADLRVPVSSDLDGSESGEWYRFFEVPVDDDRHVFMALTQHHDDPPTFHASIQDAQREPIVTAAEVNVEGGIDAVLGPIVTDFVRAALR